MLLSNVHCMNNSHSKVPNEFNTKLNIQANNIINENQNRINNNNNFQNNININKNLNTENNNVENIINFQINKTNNILNIEEKDNKNIFLGKKKNKDEHEKISGKKQKKKKSKLEKILNKEKDKDKNEWNEAYGIQKVQLNVNQKNNRLLDGVEFNANDIPSREEMVGYLEFIKYNILGGIEEILNKNRKIIEQLDCYDNNETANELTSFLKKNSNKILEYKDYIYNQMPKILDAMEMKKH